MTIPADLTNVKWASSEAIQPFVKVTSVEIKHTYDELVKPSKSKMSIHQEFEQAFSDFINGKLMNGATKIVLTFNGSDGKTRTCEANLSNVRWLE